MPKAKKASKTRKGSKSKKGASRARKSSRKTSARSIESGPVPPYGVAIREAIARGNVQEMRQLANTTRQWLDEVNEALNRLETSIDEA